MKKILFFTALLSSVLFAQEICDNGIDDDGNGLIDLNDPSCASLCVVASNNLIPNASFEGMDVCPSTHTQMYNASGWQQASDATSDYFNTCGYLPPDNWFPYLPSGPLPNGNGFVGFYDVDMSGTAYKEYVGSCLTGTMLAGQNYSLSLNVGIGTPFSGGYNAASSIPFELAIYGNTSCVQLPFTGYDCPLNSTTTGWVQLGSVIVNTPDAWVPVTINFTPATNINAIVIGPNCALPSNGLYNYYYVDGLSLGNTNALVALSSGNPCDGDALLTASPVTTGNTYQWYKDGVALIGETASVYTPATGSAGDGQYQCRIIDNMGSCAISPGLLVNSQPPLTLVGASGISCPGSPVTLTATSGYSSYNWSLDGGNSWIVGGSSTTVTDSGTYMVQVSNGPYCQSLATVPVQYYELDAAPNTSICSEAGQVANLWANTDLAPSTLNCVTEVGGSPCSSPNQVALGALLYYDYSLWGVGNPSAKNQYIFTAAELSAAGMVAGVIDGFALDIGQMNGGVYGMNTYENLNISMGCTNLIDFTGQTDFLSGLFPVYQNPSFTPVSGGNLFLFSNPYYWDGTQNIVLEFCFHTSGGFSGWDYDYTPADYSIASFSNSGFVDMCPTSIGTQNYYRPNISFRNCSRSLSIPVTYSWSPATDLSNPNISTPTANPSASTTYTVTVSNGICTIQQTVDVTVVTCLAATLESFEGKLVNDLTDFHAKLWWKMSDQQAIVAYSLERKYEDESDYTQIGTVSANATGLYNYEDKKLRSGVMGKVYYRLKALNTEGKTYDLGGIVSLDLMNNASLFTLFPTPAKDKITLVSGGTDLNEAKIEIYDLNGKQVQSAVWDSGLMTQELLIQSLSSGTYLIELSPNEGKKIQMKFVKE